MCKSIPQQEIEKKIKELQNGNEEMRKEVLQRQNEVKTLVEDLDRTNHQIAHDKKEFEKLTEDMEKLKVRLFFYVSKHPISCRNSSKHLIEHNFNNNKAN